MSRHLHLPQLRKDIVLQQPPLVPDGLRTHVPRRLFEPAGSEDAEGGGVLRHIRLGTNERRKRGLASGAPETYYDLKVAKVIPGGIGFGIHFDSGTLCSRKIGEEVEAGPRLNLVNVTGEIGI